MMTRDARTPRIDQMFPTSEDKLRSAEIEALRAEIARQNEIIGSLRARIEELEKREPIKTT